MSNYLAFECCVVFLIFHRSAGAGSTYDWNLVLHTFNTEADPCRGLSTDAIFEAKDAADNFCKQSFEALDRVKQNYCSGWRLPECRKLPEYDHLVCSCVTSSCTLYGIKVNGISSFRDCAWDLYKEEYHTGRTPAPSANFKRAYEKIYDESMENVRSRKVARTSHEAGPSNASRVPRAGVNLVTSSPQNEESQKMDLRCPFCNEPFRKSGNLKAHIKKYHTNPVETGSGSGVKQGVTRGAARGPYICDVCGMSYQRQSSYSSHKSVHRDNLQCGACKMVLSSRPSYKRHMENFHPEKLKAEEAEEKAREIIAKPHVCPTCGARFKTPKILKEHMPIHQGETYCQECDRTFGRKSALIMHNRVAHK